MTRADEDPELLSSCRSCFCRFDCRDDEDGSGSKPTNSLKKLILDNTSFHVTSHAVSSNNQITK